MFTGLVEHLGVVKAINQLDSSASGGGGWTLTIGDAAPVLPDCHLGDSICINGACLTVTEFDSDSFKVGLAPETLARTDLGDLRVGSKVNLERAMASGSRYGGHFVQGHVDTTATIESVTPDGNSLRLLFKLAQDPTADDYLPALVEKGYIALDGTSLTLTSVDDDQRTFGVMLIAHTQDRVVLTSKKPGDRVNVEIDIVGKGVAKIVKRTLEGREGTLQTYVDRAVERAISQRTLKAM